MDWRLSLAGGGAVWILVSTSLNRLYPTLQDGSPWVYWVVAITMNIAAFVWIMRGFHRFNAPEEAAANLFENSGHARMYWEAMVAQEGVGGQHHWIYEDRGRILGPLDRESDEIMTVDRFVQKMSESVDDKR